jgi:CO dehydrogenase maturation factor
MAGDVNGGHRVAVCGKGGSGKTTIAGTLARVLARRGRHVVAIDGDSNPNLALTLGLPQPEAQRIQPLPRDLLVERADPSGERSYVLREPPDEIIRTYGVHTPDNVTLLLMGRVDHAGAG